jgi:hypothetical protein
VEILLPMAAVVCFVALPIQQCSLRCLGPTEFFKGFNKTQHSRHKGKDKTNKHANCWCALRLSRFSQSCFCNSLAARIIYERHEAVRAGCFISAATPRQFALTFIFSLFQSIMHKYHERVSTLASMCGFFAKVY